ncbi:MAG: hypothetical protein ACI89W_000716 [Gammaproteobacteria bacterium]|jgi:hypothetical protein
MYDAFPATIIVDALVLPPIILGITEASTTIELRMPMTFSEASVTAS